jgi:class 3 adenylate cyclase
MPSGTVTFLFTDVEGSTRRWQDEPEAIRALLVEHDAILRNRTLRVTALSMMRQTGQLSNHPDDRCSIVTPLAEIDEPSSRNSKHEAFSIE